MQHGPTGRSAVEFAEVTKRYGSTVANEQVNFQVRPGEIHALVGENGAGKSTLMGMLSGFVRPDSGQIRINGRRLQTGSPRHALEQGIGLCAQHFHQVPTLTGFENIVLGAPGFRSWLPFRQGRGAQVRDLMRRYRLETPLDRPVAELSIGERERVEILGLLYRDTKILILDEPTAVLAPSEIKGLFEVLRRVAKEGRSILFVTHKLSEVMEVADRVTVLRGGRVVGTLARGEMDRSRIVEMIVGGRPPARPRWAPCLPGEPVLEVEGLSWQRHGAGFEEISFAVREGEIVGIGGVEGNGQRELVRTLLGYLTPDRGEARLLGKRIEAKSRQSMRAHVGVIPEDRHGEGLLMGRGLAENAVLGAHDRAPYSKSGWLDMSLMKEHAEDIVDTYDVRPSRIDLPAASFSGGNQQRFIAGRELRRRPSLLFAVHPTRGVDLVATQFLHGRLLEERSRGTAILLVSADLGELEELSDRVLIFYRGKVRYAAHRDELDVDAMGAALLGLDKAEVGP